MRKVGESVPLDTQKQHTLCRNKLLKSKVQNSHGGCGCVTSVTTILQKKSKLPEYLSMLCSNSFVNEILGHYQNDPRTGAYCRIFSKKGPHQGLHMRCQALGGGFTAPRPS